MVLPLASKVREPLEVSDVPVIPPLLSRSTRDPGVAAALALATLVVAAATAAAVWPPTVAAATSVNCEPSTAGSCAELLRVTMLPELVPP